MAWDAEVYHGPRLVGGITRTPSGSVLDFTPEAVSSPPAPGYLAWRIPYVREPIVSTGDNLDPFFINLLPEGARLAVLLNQIRVARDDFLGLLLQVGWDTIGDVAVVEPGKREVDRPAPKRLGEINFWDVFNGVGEDAFDAAIPGVQEKLSSATVAFAIQVPRWPSAILKLNPPRFPNLVQNEEFFLRMASACGFRVNEAQIVHDREGTPGLLVRRFDRVFASDGSLEKLHQEDACQLLGSVPANKYHVSLRQVAEVFQQVATAPLVEIETLLRLYMFSYLIGNSDMHAKNVSLLWSEGLVRMSPGYDLLSTLPYKSVQPHMAMKVSGKDLNFAAGDFIEFGRRFGLSEAAVRHGMRSIYKKSEPWLDKLEQIGFDTETTTKLHKEISERRGAFADA